MMNIYIYRYFENHNYLWLVFDNRNIHILWNTEIYEDNPWKLAKERKDIYPDADLDFPSNLPKPRGKHTQVNSFVDADHADDKVTHNTRTGIIMHCNLSLIF